MDGRFPRTILRARTINVGLAVGFGVLGCGQAPPAALDLESRPNGTVGTVHALIANYDDRQETIYRLRTEDGRDIGLNFTVADVPRPRVGETIAVRGVQRDYGIEVSAYDLVQTRIGDTRQALAYGSAPMVRNLKLAAISVDSALSKATFAKRTFQDADSPTAFYRDNSYGAWTFTGDAYGPYSISTKTCGNDDLYPIAEQAAAAAKADGFDAANYDNVLVYVPASQGCSWGGIAEVGVNEARGFWNAKYTWYRGTGCVVLAQELAHNYGLLHSHSCTAPPYANGASYGGSSCGGYSEYGDKYSPMGGGCGRFNAPEMGAMGFITGCNTLAVKSTGTFEIGPLEQKCAGPQVIRVPIPNSNVNKGPQYIYAEYRTGKGTTGSDNASPKGIHFYASAEYGGNATGIVSDIHDLDWAEDPFALNNQLTSVNGSWTEPASGVTFKLTAMGQTATVEVTVPSGSGATECVGGGAPPASPMCGATDGGTPPPDTGTGGTGGSGSDASTDASKDSGTGGTAGAGGTAGTGGTAGAAGAGGTAGTGGTTGGTAGTAGSGGSAGKGGGGTGGSSGTGGTTGGTAGTGTGGAAGATGGASGSGGSAGSAGSGKGGSGGGTGGSTGGSGGSTTGGTPPGDDGCSCSIPGGNASTRTPALLLGLAALLPALRRNRRSRAAR